MKAAELEGFDCVVLDTAAGITGLTEQMVKGSDFVLLPQQAEPLVSAQDGLLNLRITEAIVEAARSGQTVNLTVA